jgi:CBS domain-containing protein
VGEQHVARGLEGEHLRTFMDAVLTDLRALERMLDEGRFETGVRRIGVEQEMFLVDEGFRPANRAMQVLEALDDSHFTTELAQFNLELNLDPMPMGGDVFRKLEVDLTARIEQARLAAARCDAGVVLAGILPTIRKSDLGLESMTPLERYALLNETMTRLRGDTYELKLTGLDEVSLQHDNVMLEACNCSFQIHLQVDPGAFAHTYNVAQVATAPVLAAAANSPMLFGRRLWAETRIALFQQSIDTRNSSQHLRERAPRVSFGRGFVKASVLELFRSDLARFRALLGVEDLEDPLAVLDAGGIPKLRALSTYNGTVYRWNRACYGITDGKPHLRIENRVLPAGPTPLDEVANAAFWYGLVSGLLEQTPNVTDRIDFESARNNFALSARYGLQAPIDWLDGVTLPAADLILGHLLPLARHGLERWDCDGADIDRYLGVIEARVTRGRTGARWMLDSLESMGADGTRTERLGALTGAIAMRQQEGRPVHEWTPAELSEGGGWTHNYLRVEQFMTTDLFTVHADESVQTVAHLMDWERIRHVLVEDEASRLTGLVSMRQVLRAMSKDPAGAAALPVGSVMRTDLMTVTPETRTVDAIRAMAENRIGCLPVLKEGKLVGIVTESDFMQVARGVVEEGLRRADGSVGDDEV